jgi:ParB/RepB/Spo0J family partition protein
MKKTSGKRQKAMTKTEQAKGKAAATEAPATAAAVAPPNQSQQKNLGVESIRSDGDHREGKADVASLAASIARDGLLQPLIVCRSVKGTYAFQVLDGRRRLAAVKQLGWTRVSAVVLDCSDQDRQEALAAVANLERRDLTPVEEGLAVARLLETLGATREDLERGAAPAAAVLRAAALLGRSAAWVRDRGTLLRLCPEVRAIVADGRLPLGQAREIAKLAGAEDQATVAGYTLGVVHGYAGAVEEGLVYGGAVEDGIKVSPVRSVRRWVAERLSTLRGVPWQPDVDFAGRPACDKCPDNSANCLLFGADKDDAAPEARCLNTVCYAAKMKAAEKALAETVKKAKDDKKISPTAAGVRGIAPSYLKPATVARKLARARGIEPKGGKAGPGAPGEKKEIPYNKRPDVKFHNAHSEWGEKIEEAVGAALCASPMRVACFLAGTQNPAFTRHIGYQDGDTPSKAVRGRIEPILKRIVHGTEDDLKALVEGFKGEDLFGCGPMALPPPWVVRHLAGLLDVNLPAEPKLEDFLPKPEPETPKGKKAKATAGVCRVCGCTEDNPCPLGCAWTDSTKTLCTACEEKGEAKAKGKAKRVKAKSKAKK